VGAPRRLEYFARRRGGPGNQAGAGAAEGAAPAAPDQGKDGGRAIDLDRHR
jgi:hypothetical protein